MLSNLCWCSLEYRRYDSRLAMFYKNPVWSCCSANAFIFERPKRITRHSHMNPFSFCQVYASADYYRCSFFPMTIVLWNRLPAELVYFSDLDCFKRLIYFSDLDCFKRQASKINYSRLLIVAFVLSCFYSYFHKQITLSSLFIPLFLSLF